MFIYEKIFDSKKFIFGKLGKLILIIIARKGIKKQIIREIDIDGNKIKLNVLDYANLTKILHFAIDPIPPILRTGGDIFIDIGCHIGYYTILSSAYFKKIYAIDASSLRVEGCKENAKALGISKKAVVLNLALGSYSCPSKVSLYENPYNSGGSFTSNDDQIKNNWFREEVKCTNLDELIYENISKINDIKRVVLKIDVEGNEFNVLQGSKKIIEKFLPIIVIEARPSLNIYKKIYSHLPNVYQIFDASEFLFGKSNKSLDTDLVCVPKIIKD